MSKFDYVIQGAGCAGLSLAYALEQRGKLDDVSLAIVDPRVSYQRDKTWSFWRLGPHAFEDCVLQQWDQFRVRTTTSSRSVNCNSMPYQSVDSGLFYQKVLTRLAANPRIEFIKDLASFDAGDAVVFNSVPVPQQEGKGPWQHFKGIEIHAPEGTFDVDEMMLMDFDCDQRGHVHFFYVLPFSSSRALVETTWLGPLSEQLSDYDQQLSAYVKRRWGLSNYTVSFTEQGAIPLFEMPSEGSARMINIGGAGGMIRQSTGYAFLNIQDQSAYICDHFDDLASVPRFQIRQRYRVLDRIFLRVLKGSPELMPEVFNRFFQTHPKSVIEFLSNKGTLAGDASAILGMPKLPFLRALVGA